MNWLWPALLAPLFWSACNIFDSKLQKEHVRNSVSLAIYTGLLGLLGLVIIPWTGFTFLTGKATILALLSGMVYVYAMVPYYKALDQEEASRVVTLWHLTKAWMPLLAFLFLGERLGNWEYLAFCLIIISSLLISARRESKHFVLSRALVMAIIAGVLFQAYYLLQKPVYVDFKFWEVFLWVRFGSVLGAITLLFIPSYYRAFRDSVKSLSAKPASMLFATEGLNLVGTLLISLALASGPVSLILALNSFQAAYIFVIAVVLSLFFPKVYKENLKGFALISKIIAVGLMVASLFILNLKA